jgi:hypothetical protein
MRALKSPREVLSDRDIEYRYKSRALWSILGPPESVYRNGSIRAMVRVATSLALAASVATLVSAAPAQRGNRIVISVRKGTSGKPITAKDVVSRDLARIARYNDKSLSARASSGTAINQDVTYVAEVSFCSQTFDLIVDTGSSNTWVRIVFSTFFTLSYGSVS